MKILITYYSYTGITARVVDIFREVLKKDREVNIQRVRPKKEITSFAGQCVAAGLGKRCELEGNVLFDVSLYDVVIIGLPVWAFSPTPTINTYLDRITGLSSKRFIVLITSGSGLGVKMCFKKINDILKSKGVSEISEINIPNSKMGDKDFIVSSLESVL